MAKEKKNKICPAGIAWAKRTFDRYPSAYANMAASKYCKDPNYAKNSKKKKKVKAPRLSLDVSARSPKLMKTKESLFRTKEQAFVNFHSKIT